MTLFFSKPLKDLSVPVCVSMNRDVDDYVVRHEDSHSIYRNSRKKDLETDAETVIDDKLFSGSVFVKIKDLQIFDCVQNVTIEQDVLSILTDEHVLIYETGDFELIKKYLLPMPTKRNVLFDISDNIFLYYSNSFFVASQFMNLFLVNIVDGTFKTFNFERDKLGLFLFIPMKLQGHFLVDKECSNGRKKSMMSMPTKKTTTLVQLCLAKTKLCDYPFPDEIVEIIMQKAGYLSEKSVLVRDPAPDHFVKRFENCMDFLPKLKNVI